MTDWNKMTVTELREETKRRGLPQQANGRKFIKSELVENLMLDDKKKVQPKKTEKLVEQKEGRKREKPAFATNFREIIEKYSGRKPEKQYEDLKSGDMIVFVHHVDARDGNVYKKIRQAKVTEVDQKTESIHVVLFYGGKLCIPYEDVLHIRKEGDSLPKDIRKYLSAKRSPNGHKDIVERLGL